MTTQWVTQMVYEHPDEPPAEIVTELLEAVGAQQSLGALVDASIATSRMWSLRLAAIALVRMAKAAPAGDSSDTAGSLLRLSRAATDSGDDATIGTCLTALKWLAETGRLHTRSDAERKSAFGLLWRSLSAGHPSTRSAAVHALEAIYDFGDLAVLLGDDGVQELRGRIREARSEASDAMVAEDLASAERLLP